MTFPNLSMTNILLILALLVSIGFLIYSFYGQKTLGTEHFTEGEGYNARLEVMKVFDLILNRKPTPDEITKYEHYKTEQDILVRVIEDYKTDKVKKETLEETEPVSIRVTEEEMSDNIKVKVVKEEVLEESPIAQVASTIKNMINIKPSYSIDGDKVCVNKNHLKQMLDDVQAKIDAVRVIIN